MTESHDHNPSPDDRLRPARLALALVQIGGILTGSVLLCVFAGWGLDQVTGLTPLFVFLGLGLGILGGVAGAFRLVRDYLHDDVKG